MNQEELIHIKMHMRLSKSLEKRLREAFKLSHGKMSKLAFSIIDEAIDWWIKETGHKPSCSKGCAYCCYIPVLLSDREIEAIRSYVKKHKIKVRKHDYEYVTKEGYPMTADGPLTRDEICRKYVKETPPLYRRCPFLNGLNQCSVYPVRPIPCRTHLVVSDPSMCDTNNNPDQMTQDISTLWIQLGFVEATLPMKMETRRDNEDKLRGTFKFLHEVKW